MGAPCLYLDFEHGPDGALLLQTTYGAPAVIANLPSGARMGAHDARRIFTVQQAMLRIVSADEVTAILDPTPPRCGDHVFHVPTEETWVVAYCDDGILSPAGWPDSCAKESDCITIRRLGDIAHRKAVQEWHKSSDSPKRTRVLRLYGTELILGEIERLDRSAATQADGGAA